MTDRSGTCLSESKFSPQPPRWHSVEEAREILAKELSEFLEAVAGGRALDATTLAIRVTAGTGKTRTLLELLGSVAAPLLAIGHIQIMVPTHDLAEEACREFRRMHPNVPSMVLRGRDAINPETRMAMCLKTDLAKRLGEICGNVTEALCQVWDPVDNKMRRALCRTRCP